MQWNHIRFREDGAKKVKRGMVGLGNAGKHAGGRAYGYRPARDERGQLEIVETEAVVVRRIFSEYLDGRSPRDIAHRLNADGVPPPRGTSWNASTINGSRQRCNGIIQNGLYAGEIVWNKVRMVKHPVTGRRISRPNPREEWIENDRTDLAIVDPKVFERANALKVEKGNLRPEQSKRNVHIFSGLLKYGCCGGGLAIAGVDTSKRIRVRCSRHTESRTCPDPTT